MHSIENVPQIEPQNSQVDSIHLQGLPYMAIEAQETAAVIAVDGGIPDVLGYATIGTLGIAAIGVVAAFNMSGRRRHHSDSHQSQPNAHEQQPRRRKVHYQEHPDIVRNNLKQKKDTPE